MVEILQYVFFLSWGYIVYVYLGYYALLAVLALFIRKRIERDDNYCPHVSLIISAFNEERVIEAKIANSLALDYPRDKFEILVVSDASSDATDSIVSRYAGEVRLIRQAERKGKTSGLNMAVPEARGKIIVFTDANSMFERDGLRRLVRSFADPAVGCVTGESRYRDVAFSAVGRTEGLYWNYEAELKALESKIGSMVGADGAIYSIRKELYEALRPEDINDFVNPLQIVAKGYRGVYEPGAICYEDTAGDFRREFSRKRRIVNRSWRGLFRVKEVLNPLRYPLYALEVISHKLLRWLIPFVLLALFASNLFLWPLGGIYAVSLIAQLLFYALALAGYRMRAKESRTGRVVAIPFYFCMVNLASALAIVDNLRGRVITTWNPPERRQAADLPHPQPVQALHPRRLNILFLAHRIPYPPNKGDKIRSFNEIKYLAQHHNIYLGTVLDHEADHQYVATLSDFCQEVYARHFFKRIKLIRNVLSSRPFSVANFYGPSLQRYVDSTLANRNIDAVVCFCSSMAEYVFRSSVLRQNGADGVKLIMDYVDLDSDKWRQYSNYARRPLSALYGVEHRRLFPYEVRINQRFDATIFVSQREKVIFEKLYPQAKNVSVIQNGVSFDYFTPKRKRPDNRNPILLFTGVMDYFANEDGVQWFCEKILPPIRTQFPGAEFYIVGSHPTRKVRNLARIPGVTVTGFAPDIREYYWKADVCVIPLRIARGLQNKVLEAMATGNAVVATSNARDGIICTENSDIVVANQPEDFAREVIDLLSHPQKRDVLGENAVNNIRAHYCWDTNLQKLDELLYR